MIRLDDAFHDLRGGALHVSETHARRAAFPRAFEDSRDLSRARFVQQLRHRKTVEAVVLGGVNRSDQRLELARDRLPERERHRFDERDQTLLLVVHVAQTRLELDQLDAFTLLDPGELDPEVSPSRRSCWRSRWNVR